ncbi:hypothetical protein FJZ19_01305 [Candidatus Pacearchaeota archaeon]|nr:hypothetical protein [Candidatus Pacearchaeota archaeon]
MEICSRCLRSEKEVKLLDAVSGNDIIKICEECSFLENIPIIRKPTSFQLKAAEKPYTVYERLARMSGVKREKNQQRQQFHEAKPSLTLDNIRKPKDYSQILQGKFDEARKANIPIDLIDNFNWHIKMARRNSKISLIQLAMKIGEDESVLRRIEDGFVPDDASRIIGKIEQFFGLRLKKSSIEAEKTSIEKARQPARILSFKPESMKNLTISDLRIMKQEKEKIEEEERDKEMAEKIIWRGKSKKEREEERKIIEAEQKAEQESPEEKKSRKSFWDIFKKNTESDEDKEIDLKNDEE